MKWKMFETILIIIIVVVCCISTAMAIASTADVSTETSFEGGINAEDTSSVALNLNFNGRGIDLNDDPMIDTLNGDFDGTEC